MLLKEYENIIRIISSIFWTNICSFNLAFSFDIDYELSTNIKLTLDLNRTTHFFNNLLTNGEAKTGTLFVPAFILFKFSKVNKEMLDAFIRHSNSCIFDRNL